MMRALFSGVAGLKTHQGKMDVIGNNIANVNTVGFKSSSVVFSDLLYQTTSGASGANQNLGGINAKQVGLGSKQASTNISITSGGANQTTGGAFDLKLNDGSTTNFFIVNNGSSNFFTRSGAFTVDAAGNLVMGSNGYFVMGWQVGPDGNIRKDTVSRLQINGPATQTSAPEATTHSHIAGVLDKNDKDVNSDDGYAMNLNFYDSLGYSYTAKFSTKAVDVEKGIYTIELSNIYDSKGTDILKEIIDDATTQEKIDDYVTANGGTQEAAKAALEAAAKEALFGKQTTVNTEFAPTDPAFRIEGGQLIYKVDGTDYTFDPTSGYDPVTGKLTFTSGAGTKEALITQVYGVSKDRVSNGNAVFEDGLLKLSEVRTSATMVFDLEDQTGKGNGTLWYVDGTSGSVDPAVLGDTGLKNLTLNTSVLTEYGAAHGRGVFSNINVDFSTVLNYDNEGTSSMGINRGDLDGITGLGKALGALIGLSVDAAGCIYGSYDNGNTTLLGQIPVAQFSNPAGLEAVGSSLFKQTLNSGDFDGIGKDVTSDGGSITTGTLEMSNVDLSTEFTDMITTQRGFQANSRIITTSDSLLEELINLKR